MLIKEIVSYTKELAPFETAGGWDNVGLLVGSENTEVTRVLTALDITPAVVEEARERGCGLIVSHHPVIFDPLRSLAPDNPAYLLAKYDVAALCLHTNLDRAEQGVNTALGNALGLRDCVLYPEDYLLVGSPDGEYSAADYAALIKARLNAPDVRFTDGTVSRVAVSSGGGGEGVELADQYGFDAFVTGELKHHHYLWAASHGIAAFDAGHFSTENVVVEPLRQLLAARFPDAAFLASRACICPYRAL